MKRFHVHVAVDDLEANVRFYSNVFGTQPTVLKTDYAKWMLEDPGSTLRFRRKVSSPALIISACRLNPTRNFPHYASKSLRQRLPPLISRIRSAATPALINTG